MYVYIFWYIFEFMYKMNPNIFIASKVQSEEEKFGNN